MNETKTIQVVISSWNGYNCGCCSQTSEYTEFEEVPSDMSNEDIIKMLREKHEREYSDGSQDDIESAVVVAEILI